MDSGYFRSRHFAVAAALALVVLAVGALAVGNGGFGFNEYASSGCRARAAQGDALDARPETTEDGERRVTRYRLDAAAFAEGALDLCVSLGGIVVEPAQDQALALEIRVTGGTPALREDVDVRASFARSGDRLAVGVWEEAREHRWRAGSGDAPRVTLVLLAPEALVYDARLLASHGDLRVEGLRASALHLDARFGAARATGLHAEGNVTVDAAHGDVLLRLASVQEGRIAADASFGDVEIRLPVRADVGYDALAETSFGSVTVRLGDAEVYESDQSRTSGKAHVRTSGYADKPTKVQILAQTAHGDVLVTTE